MKSFEARLEVLEALRATRQKIKRSKLQRDGAVKGMQQQYNTLSSNGRAEMLRHALEACRDNPPGIVASREQREASVRAAFGGFDWELSNESR